MKKYLFIAILLVVFTSCKKERITGDGTITTEQRNVSDFSNVYVSGSSNVYITQGNNFDVKVKAYSNLLPYLETKTQNGILTVAYRSNSNVQNDNSEVYITMPSVTGLSTSGSGNINSTGNFVAVDHFNASVSGSGNIIMEGGLANNFKVQISGSGDVKSFGFSVLQADVSIDGSGNAEVRVSHNLKATIHGGGNIYYKGNTPIVNSQVSGSGKLMKQ